MSYIFVPITKVNNSDGGFSTIILFLALTAFVTLFIACMNYVLISVSMLLKRAKTIAMLKVNVARRSDIFVIFLWETLLIVVISSVLAAFVILCFDKQLESMMWVPLSELFAWERIWAPLLVILGIFLLAGIIPSRIFASIPVALAFRGTPASKRRWKQTLIFVQLACVTFVITLLIISVRLYDHIAKSDYGYDHRNLALANLRGTPDAIKSYRNELQSLPEVGGVGVGSDLPIYGFNWGGPERDEITGEELFNRRISIIDSDYIPVMGMEIVDGRNFTAEDAADKVIVNEKYVEMRGWTESPIGKQLNNSLIIVGVVKNFWIYNTGYTGLTPPLMYENTNGLTPEKEYDDYYLMIRLSRIDSVTKEMLTRKIKSFYKTHHFEVEFYEKLVDENTAGEKQRRDIMALISMVTLFIALMGLVGYLGDEIRRRRKEIAIRRVNGASRSDIIKLIARDATLVTLPAVAAGLAGAWLLGATLMASIPRNVGLPWWIFAAGGAAVILIVYVTELAKTWRVAGSNPAKMIR